MGTLVGNVDMRDPKLFKETVAQMRERGNMRKTTYVFALMLIAVCSYGCSKESAEKSSSAAAKKTTTKSTPSSVKSTGASSETKTKTSPAPKATSADKKAATGKAAAGKEAAGKAAAVKAAAGKVIAKFASLGFAAHHTLHLTKLQFSYTMEFDCENRR